MRRLLSALLPLALVLLPLSGCAKSPAAYTKSWFEYFDTFSTLTAYADSQEQFDAYAELCDTLLGDWHRLLDIYHTYGEVKNLKSVNDAEGKTVSIEPRLGEFLQFGKEVCALTDGQTNLALGSVTALWHTARASESPALPDREEIARAMAHTDIRAVVLSDGNDAVTLTDPLTRLDAGALGKGYAAQRIADALIEAGCNAFLLNLGGNTLAHGEKPDGTPWLVAVDAPEESSEPLPNLQLRNASLVTSGSYQRYMTVDGVRYHHVIDPDSGYPDGKYYSVSVLCPDSAMADALSTALFCMSVEDGKALLSSIENAEALWIFEDGSTDQTDGWQAHAKETT